MKLQELEEQRRETAARIREYVIAIVERQPRRLPRVVAHALNVSTNSVYRELRRMIGDGIITVEGSTSGRRYRLKALPAPPPPQRRGPMSYLERERLQWAERMKRKRLWK